jgi:DNA-binding NtrC family response regulator
MDEMALIKLYILEDNPTDSELIIHLLKKELPFEFEYRSTDSLKDYLEGLKNYTPNIVLSDFFLQHSTAIDVLAATNNVDSNIPVIVVTGTVNEETAIECIKAGANDYVLKHNLSRLVPAILNTLEKIASAKQQKETNQMLAQRERELDLIFNRSPIKMMVIDSELKIRKANQKILDFSKQTAEDILNKKSWQPFELYA